MPNEPGIVIIDNNQLNNNQLTLNYVEGQIGTAEITIRGTNLLGQTVEDTFLVNVNEVSPTIPEPSLNIGLFLVGLLAFLRPFISRKKA